MSESRSIAMRIFLILTIACFSLLTGCEKRRLGPTVKGNGSIEREERSVSEFSEIELTCDGEMFYQRGDKPGLTIEADENILPYLITKVTKEKLTISIRLHCELKPSKPIKFFITATPKCYDLSIQKDCDCIIDDIDGEYFNLVFYGEGKMTLHQVNVRNLKIHLGGIGEIEGFGSANNVDCFIYGPGKISFFELMTRNARLEASGSCLAELQVSEKLDVTISDGPEVRYRGTPKAILKKISGPGSIKPELENHRP